MAHMSQTDIVLWKNGVRLHTDTPLAPRWFHGHRVEVSVDNMRFEIGTATGEGCNCLIDTLRRQLNALPSVLIPESCLPEVRRLLEQRHRHGPTPITTGDYLDLAHYWEDIVNLLWKHDRIGLQPRRSAKFFEIICADLTYIDNGERLPRDRDPSRDRGLYVARVNENHFVPLSRFVDERVLRPVPPLRAAPTTPRSQRCQRPLSDLALRPRCGRRARVAWPRRPRRTSPSKAPRGKRPLLLLLFPLLLLLLRKSTSLPLASSLLYPSPGMPSSAMCTCPGWTVYW